MPVPQWRLPKMARGLSSTIDIEVVLSKLMRDVSVQQVQSAPVLNMLRQCRRTTSDERLRIGEHEATVWLTQVPRTHTRRETAILRDDQTSDLTIARFALLNLYHGGEHHRSLFDLRTGTSPHLFMFSSNPPYRRKSTDIPCDVWFR